MKRTSIDTDFFSTFQDEPSLSNVVPICLPWKQSDPGFEPTPDSFATVAGWGRVTNDEDAALESYVNLGTAVARLQELPVPILNATACRETYPRFSESNQLCSGGKVGEDSCSGDSGGPLFVRGRSNWFQTGIVSYGTKECGIGKPGIYTKVSRYLDWVADNLQE